MSSVSLPPEMIIAVAEWLKYIDYEGFRTYLEFRKTNRQLHSLLSLPTYAEMFSHKDVFLHEDLLPCSCCQLLRPASTHFFAGLRSDGIGSYDCLTDGSTVQVTVIRILPHPGRRQYVH